MNRPARLTPAFIKRVRRPGRYGDGRGGFGLSLLVKEGSKGQTLKLWSQRINTPGKATNIGLGPYPRVSLTAARELALQNRLTAREGRIPYNRLSNSTSFREAAEKVIAINSGSWKPGSRTEHDWRAAFEEHVFPRLGRRPIELITAQELFNLLAPLMREKPAVAKKLRQRISMVMRWAIVQGLRLDDPSAALKGNLPRSKPTEHHKALPHGEVAEAIRMVRGSDVWIGTKLSFEFMILTATRSGEVRGARWEEIDIEARSWTIPPARTKIAREHVIPLSDRAMEILSQARTLGDGEGLIFPSVMGKEQSGVHLTKLLRKLAINAVPHGFRSSFRDWCGETEVPREVAEACLAHQIGGIVEQAYSRSKLLERRRKAMIAWAEYLER